MINLGIPEVAQYFEAAGNNCWRCKHTGMIIKKEILTFYCSFGNERLCGLTYLGFPLTKEVHPLYDKIRDDVKVQKFERAIVAHDYDHHLDMPPGSHRAYLMHMTYTPRRMVTWNPENWDYEGITSSWRHILISYETMERSKNEAGTYKLDPDWWETYRNQDIQDFDAYERWQNDVWRRISG